MENKPRSNSHTMCCVVGCHNSYAKSDATLKLYRFPGKWYETEKRKNWINSVRRVGKNMKPWEPKPHDRICSAHFVGNEKSNNPRSPAFNPTIFPKKYLKTGSSEKVQSKQERYKRLLNRSSKKKEATSLEHEFAMEFEAENILPVADVPIAEPLSVVEKADFGCQASFFNPYESDYESEVFSFESNFIDGCTVSTQANIPTFRKSNLFTPQKDKCVGNDEDIIGCNGFHGYDSLKTDRQLNSLAGVDFERFLLLLSFLTIHRKSKISVKNKLLLFLMKMKLGLSYSSLGVLFQLHHTTCSRLFSSVLSELVIKTKNFVFWPNRNIIDATLPKCFKLHYPNCRAIIDCTKIKTQQPKNVDQRIYTYSQYKSAFTAKFLIAITPTGMISFVSKCYGGRSTDTHITNDCGFLELLEANDVILADKGFPGIKCKDDVVLVLPPFVHEGGLSYEEVEQTYTVASVRIHVERSIQRLKIYNILNKIPYNHYHHLDDIVRMCCVLTNLQPPTIADCSDDTDI